MISAASYRSDQMKSLCVYVCVCQIHKSGAVLGDVLTGGRVAGASETLADTRGQAEHPVFAVSALCPLRSLSVRPLIHISFTV